MTCNRARSRCLVHCIEYAPAAYSLLLGYYLGDGCISTFANGTEKLRINLDTKYPQVIDECRASAAAVRNGVASVQARNGMNCVEVYSMSKHWSCVFPQHGPGMKHTRRIELVDWQLQVVESFPEQLVRGLLMSDGCRVVNRVQQRKYAYPRYMFSNRSPDIHRILRQRLDQLKVSWSASRWDNTSVARREAVARLDGFVGPKS